MLELLAYLMDLSLRGAKTSENFLRVLVLFVKDLRSCSTILADITGKAVELL